MAHLPHVVGTVAAALLFPASDHAEREARRGCRTMSRAKLGLPFILKFATCEKEEKG
jgi:hypothetical protein